MKTKNLLLATALMFGTSLVFTSCSKNKDNNEDDVVVLPTTTTEDSYPSITVSGNITTNTTWTKDKIVFLEGRVIIQAPAELTIEAGTIIKGKAGDGASASVLIVGVGAKIHATGTASSPIIFTGEDDQILPGQIESPNLSVANKGLWGGVIILGDAPVSPSSGTTAEVEGIPAGTAGTTYGGSDVSDNSGEFQYCSIRHGGIVLSGGNEINGLTLGGVGNGTTINHVEIYAGLDDGIEFFGGSVNVSDAIVIKIDDDCYDVDQSYSGTISNFIAVLSPTQDGDAFEIDGPEGSSNNTGLFTFDKGYVVGSGVSSTISNGNFAVFKSKAQGTLQNVHFTGFKSGALVKALGADAYNNYAGTGTSTLTITNNTFNESSLSGIFSSDQPSFDATIFTNNNTTNVGITNGIDMSQFAGWSLASNTAQYKMQ
ncbi:MAG: hypothetical protein H6587_07250 [Flavobacteriales bacterium]|nr:hypothetical protein [Flavobacteriales bacterium]MCB9364346.1 hypothetical protein [Flavobacteriales bacterium]